VTQSQRHLGPLQTVPEMCLVGLTIAIGSARRRRAKPENRFAATVRRSIPAATESVVAHKQEQVASDALVTELRHFKKGVRCYGKSSRTAGQTRNLSFQRPGWKGNITVSQSKHHWWRSSVHHDHVAANHDGREDGRENIWTFCTRYEGCLVALLEEMRAYFSCTCSTRCHYRHALSFCSPEGWNWPMCTVRQNRVRSPNRAQYKEKWIDRKPGTSWVLLLSSGLQISFI
jgi:hypothetical protein